MRITAAAATTTATPTTTAATTTYNSHYKDRLNRGPTKTNVLIGTTTTNYY